MTIPLGAPESIPRFDQCTKLAGCGEFWTKTINDGASNSMKWQGTLLCMIEALERADKMVAEVLSEWILPGGHLLRAESDRGHGSSMRRAKPAFER